MPVTVSPPRGFGGPAKESKVTRKGTNEVSTDGDHCKLRVFWQRDFLGTPAVSPAEESKVAPFKQQTRYNT